MIKYVKVDASEEAHIWIPIYDKKYKYGFTKKLYMLAKNILNKTKIRIDVRFTIGKHYPLFISSYNNRLVIIDDYGKECETFKRHKGYFIREEI